MAKKKHKKRANLQRRSGSQQSIEATPSLAERKVGTEQSVVSIAERGQGSAMAADNARWAYVGQDIRRILILLVAVIILQAILWFLLNHTSFGATIYHLIPTS